MSNPSEVTIKRPMFDILQLAFHIGVFGTVLWMSLNYPSKTEFQGAVTRLTTEIKENRDATNLLQQTMARDAFLRERVAEIEIRLRALEVKIK